MRYFVEVNKRNISRQSIPYIDQLIRDHHELFLEVPEYAGLWKPKHHFAQHLPTDILRFGPPRHYWCMGFEAYNQLIKNLANLSNFKNVLNSVVRFWIAKSGRSLMRACTAAFSAGEVCVVSETVDVERAAVDSVVVRQVVQASSQQRTAVVAVRQVCSFTRDGDTVEVGTWLLGSRIEERGHADARPLLIQVLEMQEVVFQDDTQLFMLGAHRPVPDCDQTRGGGMFISMSDWAKGATNAVFCMSLITFSLVHVMGKPDNGGQGGGGEMVVQEL